MTYMLIEEVPFIIFLDRNPHLKNRPLNEQVYHYNDYINMVALHQRMAGKSTTIEPESEETFFLLQENGDYLLQEDGDKIIL